MPLPTFRFTTDTIAPEHRFEAWRAMLDASHEVITDEVGFRGEITSTQFDGMVVHVMRASAQSTLRDERRVKRDGQEHLVLYINSAPARALAFDRELVLPSNSVSVSDLSQASRRSAVPEQDSIIVSLSRELVQEARGHTNALHGQILEIGSGALLAAHLRNLALHAGAIDPAASANVSRATAELLVACLDPNRRTVGQARPAIEAAALVRAKRYVREHLADPTLDPERLLGVLGVSRSTLFRMFKPLGGVASFIGVERLRAARRVLGDNRSAVRVAEVATRFGFSSSAHFGREFKRQFGMTPSDFMQAGSEPIALPVNGVPGGGYVQWVRELG